VLQGTDPSPFHLSDDWFAAWYAAFGPAAGTARRVGGLPLVEDRGRIGPLGYRRLRAATNVHSTRFDVPVGTEPPSGDALAASLLADRRTDVVQFDYLPDDSQLLALARGWTAERTRIVPHAIVPVADCRTPYARWLAARSKRLRLRLKRGAQALFDEHGMSFAVLDGREDLDALLDEILKVEQSGWKGREQTAILDHPDEALFYRALAAAAAAAGALRIAVLRAGNRITAFEYGILGGGRLFLLKVGYDEGFAEQSIGYVLAARHIQHCCEDPAVDWYDKLGNGMTPSPYKLRFADGLETLYRVTLYGRSWRGRAAQLHDALRGHAKRWRDSRRQRAAEAAA